MDPANKRLDEMNRLADMGHFPAIVNAGATANVLLTLAITWWVVPRFPQPWAPVAWVALVLLLNLAPVVLLRLVSGTQASTPTLRTMDFFRDQHRFADWVYIAASANMAFWVLAGWAVFSVWHTHAALVALLSVAFFATFSPVLLRFARGPHPGGSQPAS